METLTAARTALEADLHQAVLQRDRDRVEAACAWLRSTGTPLIDLYELLAAAGEDGAGDGATPSPCNGAGSTDR